MSAQRLDILTNMSTVQDTETHVSIWVRNNWASTEISCENHDDAMVTLLLSYVLFEY